MLPGATPSSRLRAHGRDSPVSAASCPSGRCASSVTCSRKLRASSSPAERPERMEDELGSPQAKAAASWGFVNG